MNEELIQKLVDQCVDKRERNGTTVEVLQSRKFAELIVRECIDIIDEEGSHEGGSIRSMEKIREHFGVGE